MSLLTNCFNTLVPSCFWSRLALCSSLLFTFDSCVLYKPYKRPQVEIPEEWRLEASDASTCQNLKWWEQFGDLALSELIAEALENNNDIKVAIARVRDYQARLGIISSQLYPQINAQAFASRQRTSQTLAGGIGFLDELGAAIGPLANNGAIPSVSPYSSDFLGALNLSYQLDIWGKIQSATDASYADLLAQIATRRAVVLTVVGALADAYITLRQYDMQLAISYKTLRSRQESYDLALVRFQEGLTSELEVKQAASEVDEAQIQVIQYNTLIPVQENLISTLIGHPSQVIERGKRVGEWLLPEEIPAGLPSDILEQRPDIIAAEDALVAANARIGEARALFFPNITLTGSYGSESGQLHELFTNPSKAWQIAGNLFQPIFEGGRLISNLDLTKAVKCEAYYNYQQTILTAFQEVNDALVAFEQSKKAVVAEMQRVKDLADYLYLATLQYENGLVDYLNVLDAERRLFSAELDLVRARALVFNSVIDIYRALGGGWVVDADNTATSYGICDCY